MKDARNALLNMLGIAARAGAVLPGTERVREAARADELHFVLVASDASDNSLDKLLPLLEKRGIEHAVVLDRATLGGAIGKAPLSALGMTEIKLAKRVRELTESLKDFRTED